tara:strand:+ start:142 stop:483 length:342 start_codon:yes stop_codon:yes gene_type:complete
MKLEFQKNNNLVEKVRYNKIAAYVDNSYPNLNNKSLMIKKLDEKISKGELWLGMTKELLLIMKGEPGEKTEIFSSKKTREEYYYDGTKNRLGNMSYKLKIVLTDGKVEKWTIT